MEARAGRLATKKMVADEIYDRKLGIDLSEQELNIGLLTVVCVDVQQTSDVDFAARPSVANDGCERAGGQQGVHARSYPTKMPC